MLLGAVAFAQEKPRNQPEVRVNYLNVCTPSEDDQKEIRSVLAKIPAPNFAVDFEISRGRSTMDQAPAADWVRVRREFPNSAPVVAAQYSISVDEKSIIESLVFRSREPKDVIQVLLEDTVTGAQDAKSVLATDTPVSRIKLERFGKANVVLSRCQNADQTAFEPLFREASQVMAKYRAAMNIKTLVPRDLALLQAGTPPPAKRGKTAIQRKKK